MSGSSIPEGPDWWQASDGKWYPPELATNLTGSTSAQATSLPVQPATPASSQGATSGQTAPASGGVTSGGMGGGIPVSPNPNFFSKLFDVSISEFITPSIIRVLFILGIIGSSLFGLGLLVAGLNDSSGMGVLLGLVLGPAVALLGVIYVRVFLELVMVLFRIEANTRSGSTPSPDPVTPAAPVAISSTVQYSSMSPEQSRVLAVLATAGGVLLLISPWMPWLGVDRQGSISGWDLNYNGPLMVALAGAVSIGAGVAILSAVGRLKASWATGAIWATMLTGLVAIVAVFATYNYLEIGDFDYLTAHTGLVLPGLVGAAFIANGIVRLVAQNKAASGTTWSQP
jgi:hypothetical protein